MKKEYITGKCETCGEVGTPTDLYVDLVNSVYVLEWQDCFYKRNAVVVGEYFARAKEIIPDLLKEPQYNKLSKAYIVIANAFPFIKGDDMTAQAKEGCIAEAVQAFVATQKMKKKFKVVDMMAKTAEDGNMLIVSLTAKVKFQSYLEFLEHELYMRFRKETDAVFN